MRKQANNQLAEGTKDVEKRGFSGFRLLRNEQTVERSFTRIEMLFERANAGTRVVEVWRARRAKRIERIYARPI